MISTVCVPRYGYETILQHVHRRSLNKWQVRCITRASHVYHTWPTPLHVPPALYSGCGRCT